MYTRPEIYNTCITPKHCAEQFGIDITKSIRASASAMKINKSYFRQKNVIIEDIDLQALQ